MSTFLLSAVPMAPAWRVCTWLAASGSAPGALAAVGRAAGLALVGAF
jgi:hypothetical protein